MPQAQLILDETENPRQHRNVIVRPNPQILRTDSCFRKHGRGLGHHHRGATHGAASQMHEVPIVRESVRARILAHRGNADAIP
jgi:hypothetical protein